MQFTLADVQKIATLSRLAINEEEQRRLYSELENILSLVETMNKADTKDISPMAHPFAEQQPLREDQVTEINQREIFQKIAPQTQAGLYIVPQVIETE